jgi:hypothetical protein
MSGRLPEAVASATDVAQEPLGERPLFLWAVEEQTGVAYATLKKHYAKWPPRRTDDAAARALDALAREIGCGPAMAVDAPFISRPIGVETMFLFDVTWRPRLPAARQLR